MIVEEIKNANILVTVIIPTYGRSDLLSRAVISVLDQTYAYLEIIVVDDNDSDSLYRKETEQIMRNYSDNDKIIYHKHEKNAGGCAARNSGINISNGEYIGFLDDDDEWLPEFVEKHLDKFVDKSIGAVYCKHIVSHDKNKKIYQVNARSKNLKGWLFVDLLSGWCPVSTSLFLVKKDCFCMVGLFDDNLESFQDYDMWLRIAQEFKFDYCEECLVIKHRHGNDQISVNPITRQNGLNTFTKKWLNLINQENTVLFQKSINKHQKTIYYNEFLLYRKKGDISASILVIKRYLKLGESDYFTLLKMVLILLFGIKVMGVLQEAVRYLKPIMYKSHLLQNKHHQL